MAAKLRGGKVGSVTKLKKSLKKSSGGGMMITNIPAEGMMLRFITEPDEWVEFFEHYDEANKRMMLCTDDCEYCAEKKRPSKRYLSNAVDVEDSKVVALKLPVTAASQVMKKYERYNTLLDRDYSILKEGTGLDTEYDVNPEAPSRFNMKKYEPFDLWDVLTKMLEDQSDDAEDAVDDDEDEEEEEARPATRRKATTPRKTAGRKTIVKKKTMVKKKGGSSSPWSEEPPF